MLMSTERHNGFKAYHVLKYEYEPKIGGRHAMMLSNLLTPQWGNISN